jgi:hypothetical protein
MQGDPYLQGWHEIIMNNATAYSNLPPVVHVFDGGPSGSGILDPAREVRVLVKLVKTSFLTVRRSSKGSNILRMHTL